MLLSLSIRNIVLVESLDIELKSGLCVVTGETGAGKSVILDSLSLVLGNKSPAGLLRHGTESGAVVAEFDISTNDVICNILNDNNIDYDNSIIIRRSIRGTGTGKSFINDIPVSLNILRQVSNNLVEIHGQHDQKGLMDASSHINILDEYGQLGNLKDNVRELYSQVRILTNKLQEMIAEQERMAREEDYLRHVLGELEELNPRIGEEEKLSTKRHEMMAQEKSFSIIDDVIEGLSGRNDIMQALMSAQKTLIRNNGEAKLFDNIIEALDRTTLELDEAISGLDDLKNNSEFSPSVLDQVEERLFALRAASRKHSKTADELAVYHEEVQTKISLMDNRNDLIGNLKTELKQAQDDFYKQAVELSTQRKKVAKRFEQEMIAELEPLKMSGTIFKIDLQELAQDNWSYQGVDKVQFLATMNLGNPPAAISKIASGGELSRFMLAFKVVLSEVKTFPTMIFDEVDTGVGGAVADSIGKRLHLLSSKRQLIVVTHQPQVASYGNYHLKVQKHQKNDTTYTNISPLNDAQRKEEIARMLSGEEISTEARAAADRLLEGA
jgi:DNA repair protein RecN (Recombination protein N)